MTFSISGRRIGLLTASASRLGGGVFEAVAAQARLIRDMGAVPVVFALDDMYAAGDAVRFEGAEVHHCAVKGPPQIGYAPDLVQRLLQADLACLHLHGIWMYPSAAGSAWAARSGRAYIVSPHGMLDPWIVARGRWKKTLARMGYERSSWRRAHALHALTAREAKDILREAGRHDSIVIPNAGPVPGPARDRAEGDNSLLFIGRIHKKKNLIALVDGWMAAARPDGARLLIAGWGDEVDVAALREAVARAGASVEFLGPVYGAQKKALLARAAFAVLPSHSEGLPMAVLEAWSAGAPMLMTQECNLPEGFDAGAAIDCGYDAASLGAAISRAFALEHDDWAAMSRAAQRLASDRFSEHVVRSRWCEAYSAAIQRTVVR
jgi:poly(glycerol-phosphate) alpha-glucosyltransferase